MSTSHFCRASRGVQAASPFAKYSTYLSQVSQARCNRERGREEDEEAGSDPLPPSDTSSGAEIDCKSGMLEVQEVHKGPYEDKKGPGCSVYLHYGLGWGVA
eukprot:3280240-Rhodomonas_salina.2